MKLQSFSLMTGLAVSGIIVSGSLTQAQAAFVKPPVSVDINPPVSFPSLPTSPPVSITAVSDFSFTGSFNNDADIQSFFFTANGISDVTFRSYSYAGGTNSAGTVIPAGGFDPILAVFDSDGNLILTQDDGPDPRPSDPVTGASYDVNLSELLSAGTYLAVIYQYNNFPIGPTFADGFFQSSPTFTSGFECSNGQFCDVTGDNRTNQLAFDISGVENASTVVPEPTTILGSLVVLALGNSLKRKKRLQP